MDEDVSWPWQILCTSLYIFMLDSIGGGGLANTWELVIHYWIRDVQDSRGASSSEMMYTVSGGALNSTHSFCFCLCMFICPTSVASLIACQEYLQCLVVGTVVWMTELLFVQLAVEAKYAPEWNEHQTWKCFLTACRASGYLVFHHKEFFQGCLLRRHSSFSRMMLLHRVVLAR